MANPRNFTDSSESLSNCTEDYRQDVCRIEALCECTEEDKKGEPRNVMYGWCLKCRAKFPQDYKKVEG